MDWDKWDRHTLILGHSRIGTQWGRVYTWTGTNGLGIQRDWDTVGLYNVGLVRNGGRVYTWTGTN